MTSGQSANNGIKEEMRILGILDIIANRGESVIPTHSFLFNMETTWPPDTVYVLVTYAQ